MRRTARALVLTLALAVLLAGCHPPTLTKVRGWPGATPVFASEEEALAAAEEAYGEYVRVADQIFIEGGANPERLAEVATGDQLAIELRGFEEVAQQGYRSTGGTVFEHMVVQSWGGGVHGLGGAVVVYLCEDISTVDVLDSSGISVVSPSRPDRVTYEVTFDLRDGHSTSLLVSLKEPWSDEC